MSSEEKKLDFIVSSNSFGDLESQEGLDTNTPASGDTKHKASSFFGDSRFSWLLAPEEAEEEEELPLLEELDIDLKDILYKIRCVLLPIRIDRDLLASPDFWGPMLIVVIYGLLLAWGQFSALSWVFTVWLFGSFIIFVLTRALGGEVSFSQTVGVIGYSLLPVVIFAVMLIFTSNSTINWILKSAGIFWSCFSAASLLASQEINNKRVLVMYPVLLLYIYFVSLQSGV